MHLRDGGFSPPTRPVTARRCRSGADLRSCASRTPGGIGMSETRTVLAQILRLVPRGEFEKLAHEHGGEKRVRSFPCWAHFVCVVYAQLSRQTSRRDLVLALETKQRFLYHCFGTTDVRRTTLADANERRPYALYESLFIHLYEQCRIQAPEHRFRFRHKLYSFDASLVALCLSVFPWAKFRRTKGAIP